jgi:simple sugar transport system permease protein
MRGRWIDGALPPLVALAIALVVGDVLILAFGASPREVWGTLLEGTWGNAYGIGQVLYKATTLTCTGLSVALALRAGLFNIAAESQLAAGGFGAAMAGLLLPAGTPLPLAAPFAIGAAMTAGGLVGAVPGALKAKFGASEVIVTIMLNFIVLAVLNWAVAEHLHVPDSLHTAPIRAGSVPRFADWHPAFRGSAANAIVVVALTAAAATWWFLFRSREGYALRAVGTQPSAAEYGGIDLGRTWFRALVLSGALAGLGGVNYVLGYKGWYEEGFGFGAGFLGIAVALVGRSHPFGVVAAALLFATLSQGGLAVNALVPKQLMDVLQAVVILAVVAATPEVQRVLAKARAARPAAEAA